MIKSLTLTNFKCFQHAFLEVRPLTVLTGVNGGGKSTVVQALLLARAAVEAGHHKTVALNGPYGLELGAAQDVLYWAATEPTIAVSILDAEDRAWQYRFAVPDQDEALRLIVDAVPTEPAPGIGTPAGGFTYLCAERLGPRDLLSVSAAQPDDIGVGVRGQYTAQVLALRETRAVAVRATVRECLRHPSLSTPLLRLQAEAWASEIIRPIRITAQLAAGLMASTIRFEDTGHSGDLIRPANMGFGVSYALPIVVAGLLTTPNDMLIVENPEAHLHPAGQSRLGRFLARVASTGVQVFVETHSDHLVNGIRLAVAEDQTLAATDVMVHYFDQDQILPVTVNSKGEMNRWPSGFFDQIENDLKGLSLARRKP